MRVLVAASIVVVIALIAVGFFWVNRPQLVSILAPPPADFPRDSFSHEAFESVLGLYLDDKGNVDYETWHSTPDSVARLDAYLAAVSLYSPDSTPERFTSRNEELVYWIQGYNAYVIKSVLDHWPIDSVTDVKAPIEAVTGLGFFYRLRFKFGGVAYSLFSVENDKIRGQYRDARIHFVLNCASESCPVLRPELPTGPELDTLLQDAATQFVSDPRNVSIDHEAKKITLSTIFKWFRKDFINDLQLHGRSTNRGLIDYVASVAPDDLRSELDGTDGYELVFREYDWAINSSDLQEDL